MRVFEYKVIENTISQQILDGLGAEGWELRTTFTMVKKNPLLPQGFEPVSAFVFIREKESLR